MKLTQHLGKCICVSERKRCHWNGSVFGRQQYSCRTHISPPTHREVLFVWVIQHLCLFTSLMENLGLVGWAESRKENLHGWKQKGVKFGCNHRSGVWKVFSMLDALNPAACAPGQNKEVQLPRTLAVGLLCLATPQRANSSSLPVWCHSAPQ